MLRGVEVLLAALARMASGESEGLHRVLGEGGGMHGEEVLGAARPTLSLCRLPLDRGRDHSQGQ